MGESHCPLRSETLPPTTTTTGCAESSPSAVWIVGREGKRGKRREDIGCCHYGVLRCPSQLSTPTSSLSSCYSSSCTRRSRR